MLMLMLILMLIVMDGDVDVDVDGRMDMLYGESEPSLWRSDAANLFVFRISHDVHQQSGLRAIPSATDQCLVRVPGGLASKTSRARVFCDLQSSRRYAFLCLLTQATAARKRTTNASRGSMWTGSVTAKRARSSRQAVSMGFKSCEHLG